jgi:microcompartment protein CcmL/EutN
VVADAVVKKAQVQLVSAGPVSPGKYLLLFAGEVAEVDESFRAGKEAAGSLLLDSMYLPQAHPQLMLAMRGRINAKSQGAVAVVETQTVAAALLSADKALKAAAVTLIQAYFARGIGGKGYYVFSGKLEDVEAALEAAVSSIEAPLLLHTELIAQPHGELNGVVF